MKNFLILLILSFVQADYLGGFSASAIRYDADARTQSLGGATLASPSKGFVQFSNPAILHRSSRMVIGMSYFSLPLDRSIQVSNFIYPLPPKAAIGISLFRAGTDNILGRDSQNNITSNFSSSDIMGMISFGVNFNKKMSLGVNIKTMISYIDIDAIEAENYFGNSLLVDIAANYMLNEKIFFAFRKNNISQGLNWKLNFGDARDPRTYIEDVLSINSFGVAIKPLNNAEILFQQDFFNPTSTILSSRFRMGIEYLHKFNSLSMASYRAGLKQKYGLKTNQLTENTNFSLYFGFGIEHLTYMIDYSLNFGNENEGFGHLISCAKKL